VGVYRLWRDSGYAVGALLAGAIADAFGLVAATLAVAALNLLSGLEVTLRMRETLGRAVAPAAPGCIEPEQLRAAGNVVVVDVRSPEEFAAGHVQGALNIPLEELAQRAGTLPRAAAIVTACGKGGGRSDAAAALLRGLGFESVRPLCGGTQAWLQLQERSA
jgi:rhodanese-related sulfurtransferase